MMKNTRNLIAIIFLVPILSCQPENNADGIQSRNNGNDTLEVNDVREDYLKSTDFDLLQKTYDDPNRGSWQNPQLVLEKLGLIDDKIVADIGAGSGYFTFKLAPIAEKVLAIDIDQEALNYISRRRNEFPEEIASRIETRKCAKDDPLLQEGEADVVLIVNTYHFINDRITYLKKVRKGLTQGGRLVIVDYKTEKTPVGPPAKMKISPSIAVSEIMKAGFDEISLDNSSLKYQYIITAN